MEIRDGTAFVSLSPQIKGVSSKHMSLVLRALVNTMTEVPGISRVQILVGGKKEESLARKTLAAEPVQRHMNCVARQGYRPIPNYDLEAGEMLITGLVSALDAERLTISLQKVRVPLEVYSGSGRRQIRIERQDPGKSEPGRSTPQAMRMVISEGAAPVTPAAGEAPVRMLWHQSERPEVHVLGDTQKILRPDSVVLEVRPLPIAPDAIIHEEDESFVERKIALGDVNVGDIVRIILTPDRVVRAIVVCHQEE